jgi:putative PIG3 family NAD(P)H quinone oxidoreductase
MQAIIFTHPGEPSVLHKTEIARPIPQSEQILIKVHATALNRADTLQRQGKYPPPPGESEILGLEIAGEAVAVGSGVHDIKVGQRLFGLVAGGGYAEYCLLDHAMAIPIPDDWDYIQAAAIPENFFTANETIFELGRLKAGETLLIHAAASGVGTAAIQMACIVGAQVYATAGSALKCEKVLALGATAAVNYKTTDFVPWLMQQTGEQGVDVVEDFVGKAYLMKNLSVLKPGGRLIQVATMSGAMAEIDLRVLMSKRLQLIGSVMRNRSVQDKRAITARFKQRWWPMLCKGAIQPVIDSVYSWDDVSAAHARMEANENIGKIVLKIR